jgi:chemotaxis protein methyltransferase CheR
MNRPPRPGMSTSPAAATPPIVLTETELRLFCEFFYRRTGMIFGESKRYYIERRVTERMVATASSAFPAYLRRLQSDENEVQRLINSVTVNETYFYREEHQLRCLGKSLLGEVVRNKRPGDLVRIWSVPCSTGEEPYSIAIWLLENWPLVDVYNIEIVGSDIDTRALVDAEKGLYGERALARLPPDVIEHYFDRIGSRDWRIVQDIQESVTFTKVNLVDGKSTAAQGQFDVIFCRNVLIYFDEESRLSAALNLYERLFPGAYICLGHTEFMARISDRFETCRFEDAVVYRKPDA